MTFRRRLAVLAASSLVLAGCAVPGQPAAPGVAASYQGVSITTSDLDALAADWAEASQGSVTPDRQELATFAALGPGALEAANQIAEDAGTTLGINDGNVRTLAENWFAGVGATDPVIPDSVVESMSDMLAIYFVVGGDPTLGAITEIAEQVQADATFSPRLGEFSTDALTVSLGEAMTNAQNMSGNYYVAFVEVSGFEPTTAPWAARD
ncbi:hypothetical protein [Demequina phytophila]|uniref:hypothetical protein n=1 Tax=Demequina phytophila TaxID=1638981 RepID=UPI000AFAC3CC|nr:hypothetical protein [Demequina phytophila]